MPWPGSFLSGNQIVMFNRGVETEDREKPLVARPQIANADPFISCVVCTIAEKSHAPFDRKSSDRENCVTI